MIVKLGTLGARGAYCRFEELPLRDNKPELEVRRDLIETLATLPTNKRCACRSIQPHSSDCFWPEAEVRLV